MTRVTETKSVKVDNWGVFFLQKLQNFFNKTDHCDLTLQFNDNSQLKVHRLVLSACTDYFNMLEQTCEMIEDILVMPLDLQADVIVPIVNFMYTGTLEFQYNMYEKLLKTARDMNMTVLLKLLEAHRQTTARLPRQQPPVLLNKQAPQQVQRRGFPATSTPLSSPLVTTRSYPSSQPSSIRATSTPKSIARPVFKHHQTTIASSYTVEKSMAVPEPIQIVTKYANTTNQSKAGPSRFEVVDGTAFEGSFDPISYESKPLVTEIQLKQDEENSPFEKLRKGYTNKNVLKRTAAPQPTAGPIAKKLNLQDVKEFTEAARVRNKLETELEDPTNEYIEDDTPFNDDDDDEEPPAPPPAKITIPTKTYVGSAASRQITIKQSPNSPVKQITVKDDSGNVDHAKIISEVLKKYPHLVKNNKNIKLKIMQKTSPSNNQNNTNKMEVKTSTPLKADMKMVKHAKQEVRQNPTTPVQAKSNPPKKIDAKTMHELIAKGAENMTGPWLCLRCGINGRPISIPSYKAFRNHLVVKHQERIDPRICEHCGWRADRRNPNLYYHWLVEHNIRSAIKFPKCDECDYIGLTDTLLNSHMTETHGTDNGLQQCIYCNKCFKEEMELYEHMKSLHKEKAQEDGVCNFSDEDEVVYEEVTEKYVPNDPQAGSSKIKVLSNISLPAKGIPFVLDPAAQSVSQIGGASTKIQHVNLEPSSEAEAMSNVASGIATSLGLVDQNCQYIEDELANVHGEFIVKKNDSDDLMTKLITADGTELELTQSQKDEIISQLQGQAGGDNVVMVLNDEAFAAAGGGITLSENTGQIIDTSELTGEDHRNIVLMYSDEQNHESNVQMIKIEKDVVQESHAKLEEASENVVPIKTEKESDEERKNKEKMKLISELEGDWTEEDEEDLQKEEAEAKEKANIKTEQMSSEEIPENLLQSMVSETSKIEETEAETVPKIAEKVAEALESELEDGEKNIDAMLKEWDEDNKNDAKMEDDEESCVKEENVSATSANASQEVVVEEAEEESMTTEVVEEAEESNTTEKESQEVVQVQEAEEPDIEAEAEKAAEGEGQVENDDDDKIVVAVLEDSEIENKTGDESMEVSLNKEGDDEQNNEMSVDNTETNGEKQEEEMRGEKAEGDNEAKSKEEVVSNLLGDWEDDDDL